MKKLTGAVISLFFLVFLVQVARAADVEMNGSVGVSGAVTATSFSGSGSGLTNLNPGNITSGTANINISGNAATATTANSVSTGGVNTSGIVDGAVTPAKMAFFGKVAVVTQSGGDYTNPATAMSNYASWCGTPSASNPCLLKIMPGVYDIGSSSVVMQPYIDIEGSGENTTIITGNPDGNGTINGASNAEIRFLTVVNTGGGTYAIAIQNVSGASPKITNVTAEAMSAGTYNQAIVNNNNSATIMENVTASASGGTNNDGVYNTGSPSVVMRNVTATASGGTVSNGVLNDSSGVLMENVDATASDGATNNGIMNISSAAHMDHVSATASGGGERNGVFNQDSGSSSGVVLMFYVRTQADGTSGVSTGVQNLNSSVAMEYCGEHAADNSTTSVKNGVLNDGSSVYIRSNTIMIGGDCTSGCFGIYNTTSGTVKINHSTIFASTNSLYNDSSVTTLVGATNLSGAVYNAGSLKCVSSYNGSYDALNSSCQ